MHRELKLVVLVFLLVVGPAVGLSFLAGRILGNWNVILQNRMETAASKTLDGLASGWLEQFEDLRQIVVDGIATQSPAVVSSTAGVSNAWFRGLYLFQAGRGLIYPADQTPDLTFPVRGLGGDFSEGSSTPTEPEFAAVTNPVVVIGDCLKILQQASLPPAVASRTGLRLARACSEAGRGEDARKALCGVARFQFPKPTADERYLLESSASQSEWPRDPEEGFFYDLVALGVLADQCREAGAPLDAWVADLELARRVLERYDAVPPLQRESIRAHIAKSRFFTDSAERSPSPQVRSALLRLSMQWHERERERCIGRTSRLQVEQEFERISKTGTIPSNGWVWVTIGSNEFIVTTVPQRNGGGESMVGAELDRSVLLSALAQSTSLAGRDAGIGIQCGVAKDESRLSLSSAPDVFVANDGPLLAERRLAFPLDWVRLVALPVDPQAFVANMRLQVRLYGWGGLMLIVSVVLGGWLVWREAVGEIRRARERSEFAAAVSHDLRTPLSSMRMLAESLYLGRIEDEGKRRRFLEIILKESDRLSRLTDRALYFIQYGQGALRYRMTEGDMAALVRDVAETFVASMDGRLRINPTAPMRNPGLVKAPTEPESGNPAVSGRGAGDSCGTWVVDLYMDEELPPVRFDAGAMEQVFFNLLDNAVKYSGDSKYIIIRVEPDAQKKKVVVAIQDFGVGIEAGELKRVFKAYQRGRGSANTVGLGLGLALCRDVVKAHRGRIGLESQMKQGSVFRVLLPGA